MAVLTLLLCSITLYLPHTATAQHEGTISADELAALPHTSQRVVEKLLQHMHVMQSDIAALIERDRERQSELHALLTVKLSEDEQAEQLRQRVAALEDAAGHPGAPALDARPDGAGDPNYRDKQCPEGTGFHLKGVMKCVPNPQLAADLTAEETTADEETPELPVEPRNTPAVGRIKDNTEGSAPGNTESNTESSTVDTDGVAEPTLPAATLKTAAFAALSDALAPARQLGSADPWAAIELYRGRCETHFPP